MYLPAATVTFLMRDETGSTSRLSLRCAPTVEGSAALDAGRALLPYLAAISGCVCDQITVSYFANLVPDADATGPHSPRGVFLWSCDAPEQYKAVPLPGVRSDLVAQPPAGDGITIDTSNPAVADFITAVRTGIWCNPFGYDILRLEAAYLQNRDK